MIIKEQLIPLTKRLNQNSMSEEYITNAQSDSPKDTKINLKGNSSDSEFESF